MRIQVVAVGKVKEAYLRLAIAEYEKRLRVYCKLDILEISEESTTDSPSPKERLAAIEKEGERTLQRIRDEAFCVALDLRGRQLSSEQLSARLDDLALHGRSDIVFVIGGAVGLAECVRARADMLLSFSAMTFTHQMIRVLLLEQIYRAIKISRNEKYHW